MFPFRKLRNLAIDLRTFICLAISLPPMLLMTAPRLAAEQNAHHPGDQFAYAADNDSGQVSGFTIHRATGKLTPIEGSPFTTGRSGSTSVAVDPAGRFLYATNQFGGDNNVSGFRIDCGTGRLTPITGSPFAAGSAPTAVAIDPSGKFAYVANLGSNSVSAYTIDQSNGRLSPVSGSPFPAGTFPSGITVDPMGKFVYVTNELSNNVSGYTINATTGALTPIAGSPFPTGFSPMSVAVDPNDRFVYVANLGSANISGFSLDPTAGGLSPLGTSPFPAGGGGVNSVAVDPTGQMVYLAGYGGLFVYTINQNRGSVTTGFPPSSAYGQLTPVSGSPFGGGEPNFVAVDYTGTFLYAANKSSNDISAYKIGSSSTLTPISGSPFSAGSGPVSIALARPRTNPIYAATEIPESGNLGTVSSIRASGINNKGEASGTVFYYPIPGDTFVQAFVYSGGVNTGIANSRTSSGNAINNKGQVVGLMSLTPPFPQEPPQQAFLYTPGGSVVDIDNVVDRQSNALSVNNAGDVTGSLSTGACLIGFSSPSCLGNTHAFIYKGAGLVDIGTLGGTYSAGSSINDHDEIAGVSSVTGSSLNHLFLYAQGHMRDLGTVAGESFVNAEINDRGEIVGSATNSAGVGSSFIYRGHSFEKIPLIADSLNNKGEIAGTRTVANGSSQAFLYKEGKLINLNDLVDPSLTLLTNADGISDNGKIVASGLNGHLYVLTPK